MPASGPTRDPRPPRRYDDLLYAARRTLHTGVDLLHRQAAKDRLTALFAAEEHVEVEATWGIYQRMIAATVTRSNEGARADAEPDRVGQRGVPLSEVITLGRTLKKRAVDVLAYFDRPAPATAQPRRSTDDSNTCRSALGFRNLTNYIARSLLRDRRLQAAATPWIMKSPQFLTRGLSQPGGMSPRPTEETVLRAAREAGRLQDRVRARMDRLAGAGMLPSLTLVWRADEQGRRARSSRESFRRQEGDAYA